MSRPDDYDETLDNADECLEDLEELEWKFPIGVLFAYAQRAGLPPEILEALAAVETAAGILRGEGADAVWAFAHAAGMTEELRARQAEKAERRRRIEEDPNSLISRLRQAHQ